MRYVGDLGREGHFSRFQYHYVRMHRHDPNFFVACSLGNCSYTTKNWGTFRSHIHRKHQTMIVNASATCGSNIIAETENYDDAQSILDESMDVVCGTKLKTQASIFTLNLEARHNLSQSAINDVVRSTSCLLNTNLLKFRDSVKEKLEEKGVDVSILDEIPTNNFLDELDTSCKRFTHYKQSDEIPYVSPEAVLLNHKYVTKNGKIIKVPQHGYYVPLENSLQRLLELPEVWHYINNPHFSKNQYMYDICDGSYIRNHPLFSTCKSALQLIINTDDLEVVNPLGSHIKKHKITVFYYTIGNIPPQYRSTLHVIQLIGIAKTKYIRSGDCLEKFLGNFISVTNQLSGEGLKIKVFDEDILVKGSLVVAPADTPASHWLGGFKEGVSFALKNCRNCDTSGMHLASKFLDHQVKLRDEEEHRRRCQLLGELSANSKIYWSKMWGINKASCLLQLEDFPITAGLVQDPMHLFLEGIVPLVLSLLLYRLITVDKYFSIKWLNSKISGFKYSYLHKKTTPESTFERTTDGSIKVKQSSSALLTLCSVFPLMIASKIPKDNQYWAHFLKLLQLVHLSTSSYCSDATPCLLRILVAGFLNGYKSLYPKSPFTPKMHYLIHLPKQMSMFGPLRHHWCMRFEGKHGFFKAKKYRNFINLPYSMARHHQLYMAHRQVRCNGEGANLFLYEGDLVSEGCEYDVLTKYPHLKEKLNSISDRSNSTNDTEHGFFAYLVDKIQIQGLDYRVGCCLVKEYEEESDCPLFCILRDMFVHDNDKYFIVELTDPAVFDTHTIHHTIIPNKKYDLLSFYDLRYKWPLSLYSYGGNFVALNSNSHICEIF